MTTIKREAIVAYSARQMFELVDNIEDYPRFLPWCSQSKILKRTETEVDATLEITWKGMRKSFTTRNELHPYNQINLGLISGPFRHLAGKWYFKPINDKACKVCVELEFEFNRSLIDKLFQPIFNGIANSLVDAFCKRAVEVYGHPEEH